jgi:glycosyltransferase involved in cell wall biosynthesis
MSSSPRVSVIVPTYNRAGLLIRAIDSILSQTFTEFEVIVIDDASTDGTAAVLSGIADPRVRVLRHDANGGGGAARNTGIVAARAEYLAFLDSDDVWLPRTLETLMKAIGEAPPEVGVCYGRFRKNFPDGTAVDFPCSSISPKEGDLFRGLLRSNFITLQASVVRMKCFLEAGGFNESLRRLHDWELFIRISRKFRFRYIDEPLAELWLQGDSVSMDEDAGTIGYSFIHSRYKTEIESDRKLCSRYLYIFGKKALAEGNGREAAGHFIRLLRTNPVELRLYPKLVRSLVVWIMNGSGRLAAAAGRSADTVRSLSGVS